MVFSWFNVLFFTFILKKSTAVRVFIIDIPEDDIADFNESEYIYYDYEQSLAPNVVKNKPLLVSTIGLAHPTPKDGKNRCDRFGSMYGIEAKKHRCDNLRLDDVKAPFKRFVKYYQPNLLARKKRNKHVLALQRDFSQDYVDDFWRSRQEYAPKCTVKDVLTNKCNYRKFSQSFTSDSDETSDAEVVPKRKKPKRFQVVSHQDKKNNKETVKEDSETSESSEESEDDDSKQSIKMFIPPTIESEESDFIPEQSLTDIDEDKEESKESSRESDSFEDNKPKTKYEYLQGHRLMNAKDFRRSRMEHFLPKRNTWKREDIPKLGFFWFEGGPKGII